MRGRSNLVYRSTLTTLNLPSVALQKLLLFLSRFPWDTQRQRKKKQYFLGSQNTYSIRLVCATPSLFSSLVAPFFFLSYPFYKQPQLIIFQ